MPFEEIVTNPSDPKHVLKLLGYSDGLGVVITTGVGLLGAFKSQFPNPPSGLGRRLVRRAFYLPSLPFLRLPSSSYLVNLFGSTRVPKFVGTNVGTKYIS